MQFTCTRDFPTPLNKRPRAIEFGKYVNIQNWENWTGRNKTLQIFVSNQFKEKKNYIIQSVFFNGCH